MSGFLDNQTIDIPCPGCGKKASKSVGWLKANHNFTCSCGAVVNIDTSKFKSGIAGAEKNLSDLERTLKNFGRR